MGLACASCVARSRIRSGTLQESGMVPPYGYISRKNTFLPPYSLAVPTFLECTRSRFMPIAIYTVNDRLAMLDARVPAEVSAPYPFWPDPLARREHPGPL
jgi:hypothetical protein